MIKLKEYYILEVWLFFKKTFCLLNEGQTWLLLSWYEFSLPHYDDLRADTYLDMHQIARDPDPMFTRLLPFTEHLVFLFPLISITLFKWPWLASSKGRALFSFPLLIYYKHLEEWHTVLNKYLLAKWIEYRKPIDFGILIFIVNSNVGLTY